MIKKSQVMTLICITFLVSILFSNFVYAETKAGKIGVELNLRSGPGKNYKVIKTLSKGSIVEIIDQNADWYKIITKDKNSGWASKKYVTIVTTETSDTRVKVSRGTTRESSIEDSLIKYSKGFLNVRYTWGGITPKGFDCSGFVSYVHKNFDVELEHEAAAQAKKGITVKKEELKPGDLVFFDTNGGHNYINHVGIYIGDGMFIHASSGAGKVTITDLTSGYYARSYMTAKRIFN